MVAKYFKIFNMKIIENLSSRFDVFSSSVYIVIPLISHLLLWKAMYLVGEGTYLLTLYSINEIMTYTIIGHFVDKLSNEVLTQLRISNDIKSGLINRYIVLPFHSFFTEMAIHFANVVHTIITIFSGYIVLIAFFHDNFIFRLNIAQLIFIIVNIVNAIFIGFLLNYIIGMLTFWMKDIMSLYIFTQTTFLFLSGGFMPIDLLPESVYKILMFTPFPYLLYFPASIHVKNLSFERMLLGTVIGIIWSAILFILSFTIYNRGLRRYET